jgi:hypothetical protein
MAAAPLTATCRQCSTSFELQDLVARRDGICPGCGVPLSPEFTNLLIEEADMLQTLHDAFIRGLRRVVGVPGNLKLHAAPVLRNLTAEVPWDDHLATQPQRVTEEIDRARRELDGWIAAAGTRSESAEAVAAANRLRRIAAQLRTLGVLLDIGQELAGTDGALDAGDDARQVADDLDADAAELTRGGRTAEQVTERLDAATTAAGRSPARPETAAQPNTARQPNRG